MPRDNQKLNFENKIHVACLEIADGTDGMTRHDNSQAELISYFLSWQVNYNDFINKIWLKVPLPLVWKRSKYTKVLIRLTPHLQC